ncbi:hypothetical protein, partial [Escherichia coli]|uniref:hypothetical protein n=1 Tax=Escherichia coli TaxID=562 RepID=UPI0019549EF4
MGSPPCPCSRRSLGEHLFGEERCRVGEAFKFCSSQDPSPETWIDRQRARERCGVAVFEHAIFGFNLCQALPPELVW